MISDKKYLEQYQRVKRWYARVKSIYQGKVHSLATDNYQDEVYAFFINCYHLKDWIKNDKECQITAKKIENFIQGSDALKACGDICNGSKHLAIHSPKLNADTHIAGRKFYLNLGGKEPIIGARYEIIVGEDKIDALDLATICLNQWKEFLNINKLI